MTAGLVALDLPGGAMFVDVLRRVWERGDAVWPVDQRLPPPARAALVDALAPTSVIDVSGSEVTLADGRPVEPGDALVIATSGTTGAARGVVLTHDAVAAAAEASNRRLGVTAADHWLACLPLAHVGGLSVVTRALHAGCNLSVHPGFDPEAAEASGATMVSLVPTALRRIRPDRFRTILLGGARPPDLLPDNVVTTYGMTETCGGVVYDGVPLDGVEVRIVDEEILVRTPTMLRTYRHGTAPVVDGWLATGDLGRFDERGRLVVQGRRAELIVTGGENVWPEPVEDVIRTHPLVRDCRVRGEPDPEWGHLVVVDLVADGDAPTLESIRDHVRAVLPAYCAPRHLRLVEHIDRTAVGKIVRSAPTWER